MKCSEAMKRDLAIAHRDDSAQAVAMQMLQRGTSFVPVIDAERRFVGGLTERALLAQVVATGRASPTLKAGNLAHALPTVSPDDEHTVAEQKMREAKNPRAVVVDAENHFLGIITLQHLAEAASSTEAANLLKELKRAEG